MLIECHYCCAKVDAEIVGRYEDDDIFTTQTFLLKCPSCKYSIIAESTKAYGSGWTKPIRVYPSPKRHIGPDIPPIVKASIEEAERCMQAGAYLAATAMCGRTLEAICRFHKTKSGYLATGLKELRDTGIIDARLYQWSEELRGHRNDAAHATETDISAQDANDVMTFTYAIIDYVYLLTKKFEQFQARKIKKSVKKDESTLSKT